MKSAWILVGLLLVGCAPKKAEEKAEEPVITVESAIAATKTIHDLLPLDGTFVLAATDYAKLAPQATGKLVQVLVKEGDSVKAGQVLARLDASVQVAQQQSAAVGVGVAAAQAAQSAATLRAANADFLASVKSAQLTLEATQIDRDSSVAAAKVDLDRVKAGARPQEIAQAEQVVRQAEVARDKAKADADRDASLFKEGYVSGQQMDASKAAYLQAESALVSSKSALSLVKAGARTEEVKAAQLRLDAARDTGNKRVQAAQAGLDQAKQGKLGVEAKAKDLEAARLGATQKGADSRAAQAQTATSLIRAPFDGVVTRRLLGPGAATDPTNPVLEIAKKGAHIEFAGQLSPTQAQKVQAGMWVLYGEIQGVVKSVGVADSTTGQVPVRVVFPQPLQKVTSGLFGRVQISLDLLKDAVSVPDEAIVTRDEKKVVFVIDKGEANLRQVETGPSEGGFTAIVKGLKAGEKVVLVGQHEISDKAKVEEAKPEDAKPDDPKPGDEK